jgi:hypothetical protein
MNFNDKTRHRLTCEALGCDERATTQLTVSVGELGYISLDLCEDCLLRFSKDKEKVSDFEITRRPKLRGGI